MSVADSRTVVLAFDALSLRYLDEFDLPNFDALRDRGVTAPLESTFPPWTGSAWPSMYTGVDPGHHGVYSFFDFDGGYPDDAELVTRNDVAEPAIWNYLSHEGVSTAVLNLPVTHPAEPIAGVLVPGYLAPEDAAGHPDGIRAAISAGIDAEYRIYGPRETGAPDDEMLEGYIDLIGRRGRAARWLIDEHDPAVAILQVQKTDTVFHQFDDRSAFRRVYEAADAVVGTVLEAVPDDTNVVVCSDHGIGPVRGYNIYVNEILRDAGLVEATTDGETPTLAESKGRLTGTDAAGGATPATRAVSGVASALAGVGIHPGDVYSAAQRVGIGEPLRRMLPDAVAGSASRHVDWARSTVYCRSGPELGVRINLEGREPEGVVPPAEYDAVRDRVIRVLSNARTPDGEPAFDWVKPRESVYEGPAVDAACDVLFQPAGMNHVPATNLLGTRFVPIDKYNHKRDGVFIGAGPAFEATGSADRFGLTAVAPIVLALAGCPIPARMTGSIPTGLLSAPPGICDYGDVPYAGGAGAAADDRIEDRLEDLGYL